MEKDIIKKLDETNMPKIEKVTDVPCIVCGAKPGEPCIDIKQGGYTFSHTERGVDALLAMNRNSIKTR